MLPLNRDDLPLLRVVTQTDLERAEIAQSMVAPQLREIVRLVRSIEAGAPIQPGSRCVEHVSSEPLDLRIGETNKDKRKSALQLGLENTEFCCRIVQSLNQETHLRTNWSGETLTACIDRSLITSYIENCNDISRLRCRSKSKRAKERCLLATARALLLGRMYCLRYELFGLSRVCGMAFTLLDLSSFEAGQVCNA